MSPNQTEVTLLSASAGPSYDLVPTSSLASGPMADAASGTCLGVYKALYTYASTGEDEVDMEEDQLVLLLERSDDDWAKVRVKSASQDLEGPEGLVPAAYIEKAQPLSAVKAAYDYVATAPGELSITDGQLLEVHERPADDDWILVQSKDSAAGNGLVEVGYVPANYVEEADGEETSTPAPSGGGIVIPESPPRPKFTTPEDLVAASKARSEPSSSANPNGSGANAKNDPIETWSVSQLDKKGKKKKGTLGVGNGAVFFASEADKTPVQKWQTSTIASVSQEKSKHINLEFQSGESLQFVSKDHADAIVRKLESSRALSGSPEEAETETDVITPRPSIDSFATTDSRAISNPYTPRAIDAAKSVHFAATPLEIPPRADTPDEDDYHHDATYTNGNSVQSPDGTDGEAAVALYDFEGDAVDELSVREGEALVVLDRSNDDWWKCRNAHGTEGVVPAQYVDLEASDGEETAPPPPPPPAPVPPVTATGVGAAATAAAALASRRVAEPEPEEDDGTDSEEEREREREREREKKEKKEREKRDRREREEAERVARAEEEARLTTERKKAEEKKARAAASAREAKRQQEAQEARRREKEQTKERDGKRRSKGAEEEDPDEEDDVELAEEARKIALRRQIEKDNGQKTTRPGSSSSRQGPPPTGKTRVWHDRSGQFRVEAEFKGFENGKIRLHKLNGVTIEVPSSKMSPEDMKYIAKVTGVSTGDDDDDEPVVKVAPGPAPPRTSSRPATTSRGPDGPPKKHVDWFEFFLNAGCDMDDCSRYAAAFERDKIDETILPDMKSDTLRALGLREGDIIRVTKAIEKRNWTARAKNDDPKVKEQLLADERYAQEVQEAILRGKQPPPPPGPIPNRVKSNPAPNLFAGPGGTLKDNTRRGRPVPAKSTSINVDENMLANASTQLGVSPTARTGSAAGNRTPSPNLLDIGSAPSSAVSKPSGFDDDAWTVRPSSTNPTPAAPALALTPPIAPASAPPAPAPVLPAAPVVTQNPPARSNTTSPTITKLNTELELLQKIAELKRPPSAPAPSLQAPAPPPVPSPSFSSATSLQPQQTGFYGGNPNGVRGPFAPVPANAPVLLQPLIPTNTSMNGFVPTRPTPGGGLSPMMAQATGFQMNTGYQPQVNPFQPQATGFQPQATGFQPQINPFQPQPTGFQGSMLQPQATGYGMSGLSPLMTQQTGLPFGFRSTPSPIPPVPSMPSQFTSPNFNTQSNFNPSPQPNFNQQNNFNQQPINTQPLSSLNFGGPPSTSPPPTNHAPANVFASMKSGSFGGDEHAGPNAPNYDALRTNPGANQLTSQPTGWVPGFQYR